MSSRKQTQAIITSRDRRLNGSKVDDNGDRVLSTRQLMVLFYHFYIMLNDPSICGFNDCEKTAAQFQAEMDQEIRISTEMLEKLLYSLEIAYENNLYWNPAEEDYHNFVKGLLNKKEVFDRLSCLILKRKDII